MHHKKDKKNKKVYSLEYIEKIFRVIPPEFLTLKDQTSTFPN